MFSLMFGSTSVATLLIALALGYIVCSLAGKEEKGLKRIGYLLGTGIILISGILILGKLLGSALLCHKICKLKENRHEFIMREQAPPEKPVVQVPKK